MANNAIDVPREFGDAMTTGDVFGDSILGAVVGGDCVVGGDIDVGSVEITNISYILGQNYRLAFQKNALIL